MKICIWNIDCPSARSKKFKAIKERIEGLNFDLIVLLEGNGAMKFRGFQETSSKQMPYINASRNYASPNRYFQVLVYSRIKFTVLPVIDPINSVAVALDNGVRLLANVITIKDRWVKDSLVNKTYRFNQQVETIKEILQDPFLVAGDFNFRYRRASSANSLYNKFARTADQLDLEWITALEESTVQHIAHSKSIRSSYEVLDALKLSDHPLIVANIELRDEEKLTSGFGFSSGNSEHLVNTGAAHKN